MAKRWVFVIIGAAILVGATLGVGLPRSTEAYWGPWSCQWTFSGYPVSGGTLSARGCASWWIGSGFYWEVWSDTYVPTSYAIQTYVEGSDRCGSSSWKVQMTGIRTVYNTNYGTSPVAVGAYQNCTSGHDYRVYSCNWRKRYSTSYWEGPCGAVYY